MFVIIDRIFMEQYFYLKEHFVMDYMVHHPKFLPSLSAGYIFAMTVLKAMIEAIAEAIAHIIATVFTVIIGGFISFIISALTGRKAPIIHMRNSKEN